MNAKIIIASSNKNKILELQTVADEFSLELLSPEQAQAQFKLQPPPEVEETGTTYRENAFLKARAFAAWSGMPSLGDDSGLEVSALEDRPGLYSARYGGDGLSSEDRYRLLLVELEEYLRKHQVRDRSARFRAYLALVFPAGSGPLDQSGMQRDEFEAEGTLEGEILPEPRGTKGFGYDPIVTIHSLGKTLAEVDFSRVCEIGFRGIAARKLFRQICHR